MTNRWAAEHGVDMKAMISEGGRVLTYAGWPLYTYISDSTAGQATGQAIETNGGLWYVLSPSGAVITKTP